MVYPVVLAVFATGVVVFLLTWFIPRFSGIFKEFGEDLPAITRSSSGRATSSGTTGCSW
jgi:type II secretory pathway component PulF